MAKSHVSFGRILLQIALGLVLIVGGIWGFYRGGGDSLIKFLKGLIASDVIGYIMAGVEVLAGFFLILQLLVGDRFGNFDNILGWIIIIAFAVMIILGDIIYDLLGNGGGFSLQWLYNTSMHLILMGAMWCLND